MSAQAGRAINLMVWCAARGGMRTVVEGYRDDGFLAAQRVMLVASYVDGGFAKRQLVLIGALIRFTWLLLTRRVEIVHCHAAMRGSFWRKALFSTIARAFGKPVLLHLHGSEMTQFWASQPAMVQRLIRRQLEAATRVLVLSESWRRFVAGVTPAARIAVVPNYVRVPPPRDAAGVAPGSVLFLGLVGERKGVFDLIPAFAEVVRAHPAARLTIGGNGEVERAAARIAETGTDAAIDLAGWIGGDAKAALLARAAIYTLPSYNEGLPMSVLEAMAAGLPVVTTRAGGLPELISDGEDGLLFEAGDVAALTAALARLIADPALAARIGGAARARVEARYSDAVVLPMLARLYRDCGSTAA